MTTFRLIRAPVGLVKEYSRMSRLGVYRMTPSALGVRRVDDPSLKVILTLLAPSGRSAWKIFPAETRPYLSAPALPMHPVPKPLRVGTRAPDCTSTSQSSRPAGTTQTCRSCVEITSRLDREVTPRANGCCANEWTTWEGRRSAPTGGLRSTANHSRRSPEGRCVGAD